MLSQSLAAAGCVLIGIGLYLRSERKAVPVAPVTREDLAAILDPRADVDLDAAWASVEGLRQTAPDKASDRTLSLGQKKALIVAATAFAVLLVVSYNLTLIATFGAIIAFYFASLLVRLRLFLKALNGRGRIKVPDDLAAATPASQLPRYTVLVPAYGEPEVMHRLVPNLRALDYPTHLLEVLLLLEADDTATIEAARTAIPADDQTVRVVLVPPYGPRTKPKALNYGLQLCTGEVITIYDAEDRPEPLQLRKAALALAAAPADVACVQARLDFFNPTQNMITAWFTLDYRMWFTQLLPGLVQMAAPIPLGGTSNHFRRSALVEVGAWDPHNVTEDADLGVRLYRMGYRTGVVDSVTLEEANSDFINWVKQRSRWYKGYIQTALVHLRQPRELWRDLGPQAFALFVLFVAGTPVLAALNPVFWAITLVWFVWHPHLIQEVIPTLTYFVGQFTWVAGNLLVFYSWLLSTRDLKERLWRAALCSPAYWVMMAIAAVKAAVQLVVAPSYWEKTQHGLDQAHEAADMAVTAA